MLFFSVSCMLVLLVKLTSSSYSEILQPPGWEIFERVPLQALLCNISSRAGDANGIKSVALSSGAC